MVTVYIIILGCAKIGVAMRPCDVHGFIRYGVGEGFVKYKLYKVCNMVLK